MNAIIDHKIIDFNLINSPRYLIVQTPDAPISIITFWYRAGSMFDPLGKTGLAHLIEHLILQRNDFQKLESDGIQLSAYTDKELVRFQSIQFPEKILTALEHLIYITRTANFNEKILPEEKQIVANEQKQKELKPRVVIDRLSDGAIWNKTNLDHPILGRENDIQNLNINDVDNYWNFFYTQNNLLTVIQTPEIDSMNKIKSKLIHCLPQQKVNTQENNLNSLAKNMIKPLAISFRKSNIINAAVTYETKISPEELLLLEFIKHYLTGGWMGKLIQELRTKKSFVYCVNSQTKFTSESSYLRLYFASEKKDLNSVLSFISQEIKNLRTQKLSQKILDASKNSFLLNCAKILIEPANSALWYGLNYFNKSQKPYSLESIFEQINKISNDQILEFAQKYFSNKTRAIALVGNVFEKDVKL